MSWILKLHETFEQCSGNDSIMDSDDLCPVGYSLQNAHIEVVIDDKGNFRRATLVQKENNPKTLIPVTESSSGRTSGEDPHPLCDSIQYCAGDYSGLGGIRKPYFQSYLKILQSWAESPYSHPKVLAVYDYVKKGTLTSDLVRTGALSAPNGILEVLSKNSPSTNDTHPIFKLLTFDDKGLKDQAKVFVRWSVESINDVCIESWKDKELQVCWRQYIDSLEAVTGFCYVAGTNTNIAQKHPAKLRNGKDGAKLVSSNDTNGFTFLGRFTNAEQAASISSEVTQKAHSALRWLISRKQAYRNGDQVFVSWAVSGKSSPSPWASSIELFDSIGDVGQAYSLRLNQAIAGYKSKIDDTEDILVMGIDSATPGRLAITYYQEIKGSDFLTRIRDWHESLAWPQNFGKEQQFEGAPSPRDIAEATYGSGKRLDDKLKKVVIERLIPCIVEGRTLPKDLVDACVRRSSNRIGMKDKKSEWEWEKCLGIACSLFKGFHKERSYTMALEENRTTRDYLYGRLLAVAEHIEARALYIAGEKGRDTMASRLMQRFADRPHSTWRTIELSLVPYKSRLRSKREGFLHEMNKLSDQLVAQFPTTEPAETFTNDKPLSGEFLLGYHCQRQKLQDGNKATESDEEQD